MANVFNRFGTDCLVMADGPVNDVMKEGVACLVCIIFGENGVGGRVVEVG